jgi:hypothetical protein
VLIRKTETSSGPRARRALLGRCRRLWLATFAYLLLERVPTVGCHGSQLAQTTAATLRVRLPKVAAHSKVSARWLYIQLSSAFPLQDPSPTVSSIREGCPVGPVELPPKRLEKRHR